MPRLTPALDLSYPDLASNLALDEALLVAAEDGTGPGSVFRCWELDHSAVVLGASCRIAQNVRVDDCRRDGVPIGRRSSGGGTVVIGPGVLCVTIVRPIADLPDAERSVDRAQRWVLERTGRALRALGPDVMMLGSGDLTLGGRKFVGSAQRRLRHHLMIHFSLLYDFDLAQIDRFSLMPPRQPDYRSGRSHADFVTNFPRPRSAIVAAIGAVWAGEVNSTPLMAPVPGDLVAELTRTKFRDFGWIERL